MDFGDRTSPYRQHHHQDNSNHSNNNFNSSTLPAPLLIGSPITTRTPTDPFAHSAYAYNPQSYQQHQPYNRNAAPAPSLPPRPPSGASDRLSQLFPRRTGSVTSLHPGQTNAGPPPPPPPPLPSHRQSVHLPTLTPGYVQSPVYRIPKAPNVPALPAYTIPDPPPPPSYASDTHASTNYDPFSAQYHQPASTRHSGAKGLLSRLGSLRGSHGNYGVLQGEDDGRAAVNSGRGRLTGMDEADEDGEHIGFDISGLDGQPIIALRQMLNTSQRTAAASSSYREQEQSLLQPGLAPEYDHPGNGGQKGPVGSAIGCGMQTVLTATPKDAASLSVGGGHRRNPSTAKVRQEAQRTAEKTGEILVLEVPTVDISGLEGANTEAGVIRSSTFAPDDEVQTKKSYYFPDDPDKPSWKPFSMHWPYISTLIIIGIALAALQEWLCQVSLRKAKDGQGLVSFKSPSELSMTAYFTWKYAPTLILVTYGILWQTLDYEVKRLEPYFQLSKRSGTTAAESLNIDYLTFVTYLTPIKALRYKQWAVVYSAFATLIAGSLIPVLQSASVNVFPDKDHRKNDEQKHIRIDPRWSRPVSAALLLVALCGIILLFQLRRKSGLLCDPKGIAGVAAMATRSHILYDFNGLDMAPLHVIHKKLRHRRYILHKSSLWQGEYVRNDSEEVKEHSDDSRPLMLRMSAGVAYIGFMVAFMVLVPVFMFNTKANDVIDKVPWLLVAIATLIKLSWNTMDSDVRLLQPFYILSKGNAPPSSLTLDYTGTVPGWLPIKAGLNRHWLVCVVSVGAILVEVLTVCVSSFSVDGKKFLSTQPSKDDDDEKSSNHNSNADETFKSFWVSFALVIIIIVYLCTITAVVQWRRGKPFLPRQVGTISSVLGMIHQSKMLLGFIDSESKNSTQMTKHLEELYKTYAIGWFIGLDGKMHCGIDHDPILAPYEWGKDFRKTRVEGNQIGAWEHYESQVT